MHGFVEEAAALQQRDRPDGELHDTEPTQRIITKRIRAKARPQSGDPYGILGVRRGATAREIRAAYLSLVKELHPDGRTPDPDADERLKAINEAYRTLRAGGEPRAWARSAVFAVGVLTSALPLLAIMGGYYGGWLGSRGPAPRVVAGPTKGGIGTTSVEKDNVVGRQAAFADAKRQGTRSAWARFIADYPGGEPEAFARQAIADIERAEAEQARRKTEQLAWSAAEKGTRADLQVFLERHPHGDYAGKARQALAAIARAEQAAWAEAERAGTKAALQRFLDEHPDADQTPQAIAALAAIAAAEAKAKEELAAWAEAERAGTKEALQRFLDKHGDAPQASLASKALATIAAAEAKAKVELAAWLRAKSDGSNAALRKYLSDHPSGPHVGEAKARIARLEADERDEEAWRAAQQGDSKAAYARYLSAHPKGRRIAEARQRIAELQQAQAANKDAVKEARVEAAVKAPSMRPPRTSTGGGGDMSFVGADGRIRR